jgi:hypothetical protein
MTLSAPWGAQVAYTPSGNLAMCYGGALYYLGTGAAGFGWYRAGQDWGGSVATVALTQPPPATAPVAAPVPQAW